MVFLVELSQQAARTRQIETIKARGSEYNVPRQIVDVIDVIAIPVPDGEGTREKTPVYTVLGEDDET